MGTSAEQQLGITVRNTIRRLRRGKRIKLWSVGTGILLAAVVLVAVTTLMYTYAPSDIGPERVGTTSLE
jgi:hypothetical protein